MHPNLMQKSMDFEVENREKVIKKGFKNMIFFLMDFSPILDAFGRVLGGSWGGFGEHFGVQNGSPKGKIVFFSKNVIFKGFWEGLGRVLGGFGTGFGKVLEGSGSFLGALGTSRRCFNSFLLFFMCLVAFWLFFCCFCLIIAYFACFLRLLLFAFAKHC